MSRLLERFHAKICACLVHPLFREEFRRGGKCAGDSTLRGVLRVGSFISSVKPSFPLRKPGFSHSRLSLGTAVVVGVVVARQLKILDI